VFIGDTHATFKIVGMHAKLGHIQGDGRQDGYTRKHPELMSKTPLHIRLTDGQLRPIIQKFSLI
jgi:hypothetical protein